MAEILCAWSEPQRLAATPARNPREMCHLVSSGHNTYFAYDTPKTYAGIARAPIAHALLIEKNTHFRWVNGVQKRLLLWFITVYMCTMTIFDLDTVSGHQTAQPLRTTMIDLCSNRLYLKSCICLMAVSAWVSKSNFVRKIDCWNLKQKYV